MKTHNKLKFSRNEEFAFKKGYKVTKEGVMYGLNGQVITNTDTSGYIRVGTKSKGKYITIYAHRLQAYQKFRNKIYESNILVRHLFFVYLKYLKLSHLNNIEVFLANHLE